jgi:flagella basal body P-ring formation protein FlgA
MEKLIRIALAVAVGMMLAAAARAATLKDTAVVDSAGIRLGDLFDGTGPDAGLIVGRAPALGTRSVLDSLQLSTIARATGLNWQPARLTTVIRVERATHVISAEEVRDRLTANLPGTGQKQVFLDNATNLRLLVPAEVEPSIGVENFDYDVQNGLLNADVFAPAGDNRAKRLHVSARVQMLVDVLVLARPMQPGETVAQDDLSMVNLPTNLVPPGSVSDPRDLIGRTPRRLVRAELPLRRTDFIMPILVHKNELVTIQLEQPGLSLSVEGKALEDGGQGATIRVANTRSNRVLDAIVIGPGRVAIRPMTTARL